MQYVALKDICTLKQWKTLPKSRFTPQGYPVYGANGIIGRSPYFNHSQSVIAVTCRGDTCGRVCLTEPFAYVNANAICLENIRSDFSQDFLYYYLQQVCYDACISGAAQPQITQKDLGNITIPHHSLTRQRHIAAILRKNDHLRRLRGEQLRRLRLLKEAYLHRLFRSPAPTARYCKLADVATIRCGKKNAADGAENGAYPFFRCSTKEHKIDSYSFDGEYVLLTGNIHFSLHYYCGKFDAYQRTYAITTRDKTTASVPYIYAFLEHYLPTLKAQAVGGIIKYLRRPMITEAPIPLPALTVQHQIGTTALQMRKSEHTIRRALRREEELFHRLLHELFAGCTSTGTFYD